MYNLRVVTDLDECRELWRRAIPHEFVSDLWEVRAAFHEQFGRPVCFVVAEDAEGLCAMLPLSWIEESQCYGYFPGETWQGKTWLEQNRIFARDADVLQFLLRRCPSRYHVRYLLPCDSLICDESDVDEIGYLFLPPHYDYDIENYFQEFSRKSAKRIKREVAAIEDRGVRYRLDDPSDFEHMVRLNVDRFGEYSYFHDARFTEGFRSLMHVLEERGWLRMTSILIEGELAVVDMGCMYEGVYTLLGGGTHRGYPGVAKLINLYHMRRACEERMARVDFLCGDFAWKTLFHLTPRPLYVLSDAPVESVRHDALPVRSEAHAG